MSNTIPLPIFKFSDFIDQQASDFIRSNFRDASDIGYGDKESITLKISEFYRPEHKIQFLSSLISPLVEMFFEHEKVCKKPLECGVKPDFQRTIYFIYGELEKLGLSQTDFETFSSEDILEKNQQLALLSYKIEELKIGENVIYDEVEVVIDKLNSLQSDILELKNMYPVGLKKWTQLLLGIIGTYATEKTLDKLFPLLVPDILKIIKENPNLIP